MLVTQTNYVKINIKSNILTQFENNL